MLSVLRQLPFFTKPPVGPLSPQEVMALYNGLVELARQPAFYQDPYQVPDTLEGRFDLLSLLVGTCCLRLSQLPDGQAVS